MDLRARLLEGTASCVADENFEKSVDLLEGLEIFNSAGNELFTDIIEGRNKLLAKIYVESRNNS